MLGILGLLTSWVLLAPLLTVLYLQLGGPYFGLLAPFAGIAASAPMLGFCTVGGLVLMGFAIAALAKREEPLAPQRGD